jgi:hypothetical protein
MRATARPAAKLSAPAVVLVIPRTRRIAKPHEDQVQRQSPGAPVAVEEGMHLLKGVVQPGERLGERLARPERRRCFPRRSPGLPKWLSLPSPRSNDGGACLRERDGCHAAGYAGPAPANTGQCQPPSPSCPIKCDDAALLAAGAPLQAPAVRLVQGTLTAVDVADLAPDRQVVVSVLQHRDRTCSGLGV